MDADAADAAVGESPLARPSVLKEDSFHGMGKLCISF